MNYKIRVENEAESKEVQELFFDAGCSWGGVYGTCVKTLKFPRFIAYSGKFILSDGIEHNFNFNNAKEITIQQLKDLVVLKRNSIDDANVSEDNCLYDLYLAESKELYFYHCGNKKWILSNLNGDDDYYKSLKPIEKPMKEYLRKNIDGEYVLEVTDEREAQEPHAKHWIEVSKGCDYLISNLGVNAFVDKNVFSKVKPKKVLWKRETLNDQVASAETARQSEKVLKEILKGNLPEFDFDAIDDFIESNVEQGQKHSHYKKDVKHLDCVDVYRVLDLFEVKSHAVGHAVKKLLCSGQRGAKDEIQDIQEAIDSLSRHIEMTKENDFEL